jgi:ABC-type transporter Mla subunit MlaD
LLALLSLATVDGAKIIAKLEQTLGALIKLKDSLDNLSGLPELADVVRGFRVNPNRRTLADLSSTSASATPSLRQLHTDLGELLEPLTEVADNLGDLLRGLRAVSDTGVPVISDAARQAVEGIDPIEEPLLALRDGLDQLHQNIEADAEILERIQEAVRLAREHEE